MPNQIIDNKFCAQGNHIVPRLKMTKLRTDDGKYSRDCCEDCRDKAMEKRANIKKQLANTNSSIII